MFSRHVPRVCALTVVVLVLLSVVPAIRAAPLRWPTGINGNAVSAIWVQVLEAEGTGNITVDLVEQDNRSHVSVQRPAVRAGNAACIFMGSEPDVPDGRYNGVVSADRRIGAIVRTEWGNSAAATYGHAVPATDVVVPLVVKRFHDQISRVSLQNPDPLRSVSAQVQVFSPVSSTVLSESVVDIEPGMTAVLDLGTDSRFAAVPDDTLGWMRVRSPDGPVAVQAFVNVEARGHAFYGFEGVPADQATDTLLIPFFRNDSSGTMELSPGTTGIAVVNPGSVPVDVELTYHGSVESTNPACGQGSVFVHNNGPVTLPPAGSTVFFQGGPTVSAGDPGLPNGCTGTAIIRGTGGGLIAMVNEADLPAPHAIRSAAAYNAVGLASTAKKVFLPLYRRQVGFGVTSTAIHVMNPGDEAATVTIAFDQFVEDGDPIPILDCGENCTAVIAPHENHLWWANALPAIRSGTMGSAVLTSDQPIAVVVHEIPYRFFGIGDTTAYNGIPAPSDSPSTGSGAGLELPFVMREPDGGSVGSAKLDKCVMK